MTAVGGAFYPIGTPELAQPTLYPITYYVQYVISAAANMDWETNTSTSVQKAVTWNITGMGVTATAQVSWNTEMRERTVTLNNYYGLCMPVLYPISWHTSNPPGVGWNDYQRKSKTTSAAWNVKQTKIRQKQTAWNVDIRVQANHDATWMTLSRIRDFPGYGHPGLLGPVLYPLEQQVAEFAAPQANSQWIIKHRVTTSALCRYTILAKAGGKQAAVLFNTAPQFHRSTSINIGYNIRRALFTQRSVKFNVQIIHVQATTWQRWPGLCQPVNFSLEWNNNHGNLPDPAWNVRQTTSAKASILWKTNQTRVRQKQTTWNVDVRRSASHDTSWNVLFRYYAIKLGHPGLLQPVLYPLEYANAGTSPAPPEPQMLWNTVGRVLKTGKLTWNVAAREDAQALVKWKVYYRYYAGPYFGQPGLLQPVNYPMEWRYSGAGAAKFKTCLWNTGVQRIDQTCAIAWGVHNRVRQTCVSDWNVPIQHLSIFGTNRWFVMVPVTVQTPSIQWNIGRSFQGPMRTLAQDRMVYAY